MPGGSAPLKQYGIALLLLLTVGTSQADPSAAQVLHIAAARSAADSGLMDYLAAQFHTQVPDVTVTIEPVGALQALDLGREGKADLVITHHPQNEAIFMEDGNGSERVQFMYGEYVLYGPAEYLREFSNYTSSIQVMKEIAAREYPFLTPSPRSGTYRKIEELWALAGINPDWLGYENTGSSAAATLRQAANFSALTIADLSLFYSNRKQLPDDFTILYRGDIVFRNPFHAIVVNPQSHPGVNDVMARRFVDFLVSDKGQEAIRRFDRDRYSTSVYTPSAHLDRGLTVKKARFELERQQRWTIILVSLISALFILLLLLLFFGLRLRKAQSQHLKHELERQQMQYDRDLAIQANRIKDEFISVVSHELRTPLTSIIGALGLLRNQIDDRNSGDRTLLDVASRNSERLLLVINDLLDIEKVESGSIDLDLQPVKIRALIEEAIALNEAYAKKYSVAFQSDPTGGDVQVLADHNRLIQVLTNLLSNAAKFAPANSEVELRCQNMGERVRIAVADQGPGVGDMDKQKIFEKFTQVDSSTRREKGGTGLGLAISRALIRLHNGSIGVEDNQPHGAVFYIELPVYQA